MDIKDDNFDDIQTTQKLKAALHFTIGQITQEIGESYGLTYTKPVIAAFTEFINNQVALYAKDIEAFAKHSRRVNVNCEDVKLLVRRNPQLKEKMTTICNELDANSTTLTKKGKKRKNEDEIKDNGK